MHKKFLKWGTVLALVLAGMSTQAEAARVFFRGAGGYNTYFLVKLPTPGAEYVPAESNGADGQPLYKNLPVGALICVSATVSPWVSYNNYYFEVTKEGDSQLNFYGDVRFKGTYYTLDMDGAGLGAKRQIDMKRGEICDVQSLH